MPVHFDHNYAFQTAFGRPLVDSTFTLALVTGQSVTDISQNVFANLGWAEVRLPGTLSTLAPRCSRSGSRARARTSG
jgi:itaconyl-CoA hydratase